MTKDYIELVIGVWILISPWTLGFSSISIMMWGNLIAGMIIILMSVWEIFGEKDGSTMFTTSKSVENKINQQ